MALTKPKVREILSEAGVNEDHMTTAIGAIMEGHVASIDALREERDTAKSTADRFKAESDRLTGDLEKARAELATTQEQAKADLKKAHDEAEAAASKANAALEKAKAEAEQAKQKAQADLTNIKTEYEAYKAEQEAKVVTEAKRAAVAELLKDMNVSQKGCDLAMKYMDINAVELNDKGKIANAAALRKSITTDWGDYVQTEETQGADTATPPANVPVQGGTSASEIMAMQDDGDMMAAIIANPAAFGLG